MAIIKHGDESPVVNYFDQDKEVICPHCGKKLTAILIDENDNRLICLACETKEESESDD